MTPKEKAEELVEKMYFSGRYKDGEDYIPEQALIRAKECALITLDECLKILNVWSAFNMPKSSQVIFYEEVKEELEKL